MNDNPIKYSDLVKPDDSIEKLIKQLDELNDSYMNFTENVKKNAAAPCCSVTPSPRRRTDTTKR